MTKYILSLVLFFYSSSLLADQPGEEFLLICTAGQAQLEEEITGTANLTIYQRPASGLSLTFDYEVFTLPLPYEAKVEVDFGETAADDKWSLYFVEKGSSEKLSLIESPIDSETNVIRSILKLSNGANYLTLYCTFEWVE